MTVDVYDYETSDPSVNSYMLVHQAWLAISKLAENRLSKVGLTAETMTILWAIRDNSGKLNPAELARLTHRDKQTISGLLNRMERIGLVSRARKRKGQPTTKIEITVKGQQTCDSGIPIFKSVLEDTFSTFSLEQHQQLHKLIRALRKNVLEQLHHQIGVPSGDSVPNPFPIEW